MATYVQFGCKNCGSPHLFDQDGKLVCEYCGSVYEKNVETDEERDARILYLSRLDKAESCLRTSPPHFDAAEDYFRDFINLYPEHSDGYWGLVRARYGIKYEKDVSGKEIPSCYKASYEDFRRDSDFLKACQLAESEKTYDHLQEEARLIADVCKEWREEAKKYEYDVFISFKATDDKTGGATSDSEEMADLYSYLLEEGYKVFFSPKSMRRYAGKHYDAYIFNALQSAKLMIVYGSSPEYFTSTWVQNEWTRFLRMQSKGEKKSGSLVVAYKDFNPRELPHSLREIQAIDAGDKRFYLDITEYIRNALRSEGLSSGDSNLSSEIEELKRKLAETEQKNASSAEMNMDTFTEMFRKMEEEQSKKAAEARRMERIRMEKEALKVQEAKIVEETLNAEKQRTRQELKRDFEIENGCLKKYKGREKTVVIPNGVTSIGKDAFNPCKFVTEVIIPNSVKSIGESAFFSCQMLTEVEIPSGVETIGNRAFNSCNSLTRVIISNSVKKIGDKAFSFCKSLEKIEVDIANKNYSSVDGNLYSKNGKTLIQYATGKKDKKFVIPNGVTRIGELAFDNCDSLTEVVIPNNLTSIDNFAFSCCHSLSKATLPDSITNIGSDAFSNCKSLAEVIMPNNAPYIGDRMFLNCPALTKVVLPSNITKIGMGAFFGCTSLYEISIPGSVTNIEKNAFKNCVSLLNIVIPYTVTSIGEFTFENCESLTIGIEKPSNMENWHKNWNSDNRPIYDVRTGKKPKKNIFGKYK